MTAKEYLQQVKRQDAAIKNLQQSKEELSAMMYSICGAGYGERVQSSQNLDKYGTIYSKIDEKEHETVEKLNALIDSKFSILDKINSLSDERYIAILYRRYISFQSWEEIAIAMQYNTRYVQHLHGQALVEFKKLYSAELDMKSD